MNTSATMRMKIIACVLMLANTTMVDAPPQGTSTCTCTNPDLCLMDNGRCRCCKTGRRGSDCGEECPSCIWNVNTCSLSCSPGKWGDKCQNDCPQNCIQSSNKSACNISTGGCDGCPLGYHGKTCDKPCRHTCENNLCLQGNGTCKSCAGGTYGDYCENKCSHGCYSDTCSNNGSCDCKSGWMGEKCLKECAHHCKDGECIFIDDHLECKGGNKSDPNTVHDHDSSSDLMIYTAICVTLQLFVMPGLYFRYFRTTVPQNTCPGNKTDTASPSDRQGDNTPFIQTFAYSSVTRGVHPEDDHDDNGQSLHGNQISNP